MEHKHFYDEMPENYQVDRVVDAKAKKTVIAFNVAASVVMLALMLLFFFAARSMDPKSFSGATPLWALLVFLVFYVVYVVLHELTHGACYRYFTRRKLKFGMTLTVAFCGVPDLYVKKKAALIAVLAPFTVFTVLLGVPLFFVRNAFAFLVCSWCFSAHLGGCVGDLYCASLLIFRYRGVPVVVNDTGPKQTFCVPKSGEELSENQAPEA